MTSRLRISVAELRADLDEQRTRGRTVAVVPTMGALHEGHLSLVREAARRADEVVVTIFVNPTQFGPGEDFDRYPRDLEADTRLADSAGASIIFAPPIQEMYPPGEQTRVQVSKLSRGLCGMSRPGHFEGVATVVAKLFNAVGAGTYFFGTKDYQQWRLVRQMACDLLFPVHVVGMPIVRERDGVALSSRNAYLQPDERIRARVLSLSLQSAISSYRDGERDARAIVERVRAMMKTRLEVDYVEARDPVTLETVDGPFEGELLIAVAGYLGKTRLIDNVVLGPGVSDIVTTDAP